MKTRLGEGREAGMRTLTPRAGALAVVMAGFILVAPGLAQAAPCTSPAGPEGSMIYATTSKTMFYCNGTGWVGSAGISALASLTDVSVSAPANGNVLTYNNVTSKWEAAGSSTSQWITTGSDIYYNTGNVGVGTATPLAGFKLDVKGLLRISDSSNRGMEIQPGATNYLVSYDRTNSVYLPAAVNATSIYLQATGAASGLFIDTAGKVGIGTTAPSERVEILSDTLHNIGFGTVTAGKAGVLGWLNTAAAPVPGLFSTSSSYRLALGANRTEHMTILPSGNVGIGTTTPGLKLEASSAADQLRLTYTGGSSVDLGVKSNADFAITAPGNIYFRTYSGTNSTLIGTTGQLVVNSSATSSFTGTGNVGIGTTAPGNRLEVSNTTDAAVPLLVRGFTTGTGNSWRQLNILNQSTSAGTITGLGLQHYNASSAAITASSLISSLSNVTAGSEAGWLAFNTMKAGTLTEQMRIDNNGNVGIGTPSPLYKLDVVGSNPDVRIAGSSTTDSARLMFFDNGPAPNQIWVNGIWRAQQGSSYVVANGGAVGVFLVSGATAWSATSDERVKHVYGSIENSLEKISSLRRVYFKFRKDDKAASKMHVGVIAQDVRAVLPEAVDENSDGILSVRYTDLVPLLIGGIQDLDAKNRALAAENNALEKRVTAEAKQVDARIDKLERELVRRQ